MVNLHLALAASLLAGQTLASTLTRRATGETKCTTTLCVSGTVNGNNVDYVLTAAEGRNIGWLALGFGVSMIGSDMVILWPNDDGSVTVSQRSASRYTQPSVVSNPPRVATANETLSVTSGSNVRLAFSIPLGDEMEQNLVYAGSPENPGSSSPDADIGIHNFVGQMRLDLSQPIEGSDSVDDGSADSPTPDDSQVPLGGSPSDDRALRRHEKVIVAHATFMFIGFLVLLPIGALLARYMRTFTGVWFKLHRVVQLVAGLFICIGFGLGIQATNMLSGMHVVTTHHQAGLALFLIYFLQVFIGFAIHRWKPASFRKNGTRPMQNYFHAIVGLLVVFLALVQTRNGLWDVWPSATGRGNVPTGFQAWWYIWVVGFPALYAAGLYFLPKQYRQERESSQQSMMDELKYESRQASDGDLPRVGPDYRQHHP